MEWIKLEDKQPESGASNIKLWSEEYGMFPDWYCYSDDPGDNFWDHNDVSAEEWTGIPTWWFEAIIPEPPKQ